ncbi:MAG: hypothetical protein Q9162_006394 [Coniocarpon cinnabarinum]
MAPSADSVVTPSEAERAKMATLGHSSSSNSPVLAPLVMDIAFAHLWLTGSREPQNQPVTPPSAQHPTIDPSFYQLAVGSDRDDKMQARAEADRKTEAHADDLMNDWELVDQPGKPAPSSRQHIIPRDSSVIPS